MSSLSQTDPCLSRYRRVLGFFIVALVLSGVTAFPLLTELEAVVRIRGIEAGSGDLSSLDRWLILVRGGLLESYSRFPWLAYGTDWLAFAHIILAVFFIGPFRDPVQNVWVLHAGIIACVLVIPLALICGSVRGIPFGWRLIDCSFGVFGIVPLFYCLRLTAQIQRRAASTAT